jgi:hypothetical protein
MKRPINVSPVDINVGTTSGKELMYADTLKEYIGEYHTYPNKAVFSGAEYNPQTSQELMPYIEPLQSPDCQSYLQVSRKLMANYTAPVSHFVVITSTDYETGNIARFIIQKINEPNRIWEVDAETYKNVNQFNKPGLNASLYRRYVLKWYIKGDPELVREQNLKALVKAEETIPGILDYFSDPLEFFKQTITEPRNNVFTPGGEFIGPGGREYVGIYHIREDLSAYIGPRPIENIQVKLSRI